MMLSPPGAQLAPVDPPPPPAHQDPREPPTSTPRRPGNKTPTRAHSPVPSRGASPSRPTSSSSVPGLDRSGSASLDAAAATVSVPPLVAPSPKHASSSPSPGHLTPAHSGAISPRAVSGSHHPNTGTHGHHLSRPSSPSATSIHSSTSAIFERDIEHPAVGPLALATASTPTTTHTSGQTLTHKPSRLGFGFAHGSALDHTVPAVLDDAVEALSASTRGIEGLEIEAPAPTASSTGMARVNSIPGLPPRKVSSPPIPLSQGQGAGNATSLSLSRTPSPNSPISAISGKSSMTSLAQSPPILSQLSSSGLIGTGTASAAGPHLTGSGSGTVSPLDGKPPALPVSVQGSSDTSSAASDSTLTPTATSISSQPLRTNDGPTVPPASAYPARPAVPTRMSTGRQVPGGWMSAWTREDEEAEKEKQHVHPGPGEVGVGLERTQGILGEKEKVVPVEEVPIPMPAAPASSQPISPPPSSPPPASAIPSHLQPRSPSTLSTSATSGTGTSDAKRRISFVSPTDLLLSVPTTVTSLEEITSGTLSPDHLPGTVSPGLSGGPGRSPRMSMTADEAGSGQAYDPALGHGQATATGMAGLGLGDGGEWGREGLGRGLEQRLESLVGSKGR